MLDSDNKLQIVAFSTNESRHNPNDIINIFLDQHNHSIITKSKNAVAFSIILTNSTVETKVMICSIFNLTREYSGINDVNCFLLFVDLENEYSKERFESIVDYAREFCEKSIKIFIIGMMSGNTEEIKNISKEYIIKTIDSEQFDFEYKEMNINKIKEVGDIIMEVLLYSSQHPINIIINHNDKDDAQSNSCDIF